MTPPPPDPTGSPGPGPAAPDPLVPPPDGSLREWSQRLSDTWQRSWRLLAVVFAVTAALPNVVAVAILDAVLGAAPVARSLPLSPPPGLGGVSSAVAITGLLISAATAVVGAVGWAGAIWAVTQSAAGLPATLGASLRAGLSRVGPMFGWYVLYLVLVTLGALVFVLPGIYLAFAGMLFSFAVIYERGRAALLRSAALVHRGLALAAGRAALVLLVAVTLLVAAAGLSLGLRMLPGAVGGSPVGLAVVDGLTVIPVNMVLLIGLLLTYTQLRVRQEPVSTPLLWQAANSGFTDPGTPPERA